MEDVKRVLEKKQRKFDLLEKPILGQDRRIQKIGSENEILKRQVGFYYQDKMSMSNIQDGCVYV